MVEAGAIRIKPETLEPIQSGSRDPGLPDD
jgi:hypothetical protein